MTTGAIVQLLREVHWDLTMSETGGDQIDAQLAVLEAVEEKFQLELCRATHHQVFSCPECDTQEDS